MWAGLRTEPTGLNVVIHRTYCNAIFIVFSPQMFSPGEDADTPVHG